MFRIHIRIGGFECLKKTALMLRRLPIMSKLVNTIKSLERLSEWLNGWADYDKHWRCSDGKYRTPYGDGYKEAVRDIHARVEELLKRVKEK